MRPAFAIGNSTIEAGARKTVSLPLGMLSDHTQMHLVAEIIHGRKTGPVMFVSGAVHGDEIIGVEIIRRIATQKGLNTIRGTLILVPIVNAFGFVTGSRYLPDGRDLNRSFPGSPNGSLAGQLANLMMTQIVAQSNYGIDLHSGAVHRSNLAQIRAEMSNPEVKAMSRAFGTSIMLDSSLRDGSLREAAQAKGCNILLFEAGEALRFDETSIRVGVKGVLNVMRHIAMLPGLKSKQKFAEPILSKSSHWVRAPIGGIMRAYKKLGDRVEKGELIAVVSGPLGDNEHEVKARATGIVIGRTNLPIVNRGDAVFHVAIVRNSTGAQEAVGTLEADIENDPLFDDLEIV